METQPKEPSQKVTGLICPKCNRNHGVVETVHLQSRVITFRCQACGHSWSNADDAAPETKA